MKKVTKYNYVNSNAETIEVLKLFLNKVPDEKGTAGFPSQIEVFRFINVNY